MFLQTALLKIKRTEARKVAIWFWVVGLLLPLLLTACQLPALGGGETPLAPQATSTQPQPEVQPTSRPATPAPTPQPTPTDLLLPTIPAASGADFAQASFRAMSYLKDGWMLVSLYVPGELAGEYPAQVGELPYTCKPHADYPERLYCSGKAAPQGKQTLQIFAADGATILFETDFTVQPKE